MRLSLGRLVSASQEEGDLTDAETAAQGVEELLLLPPLLLLPLLLETSTVAAAATERP